MNDREAERKEARERESERCHLQTDSACRGPRSQAGGVVMSEPSPVALQVQGSRAPEVGAELAPEPKHSAMIQAFQVVSSLPHQSPPQKLALRLHEEPLKNPSSWYLKAYGFLAIDFIQNMFLVN